MPTIVDPSDPDRRKQNIFFYLKLLIFPIRAKFALDNEKAEQQSLIKKRE